MILLQAIIIMQKKFITNLALLLFLNLLIKPFWILGIEPAVQERVGNEDFGIYFALFNFSFLLNIILDFGITNFNNKNIAQNNHLLTKHFSGLFVLKLVLAIAYILITLLLGLVVGYDFRFIKLLLLLGFNQFLISLILYLRSNLAGLHLFSTDSFVSVLDRLIMISICAVLLWGRFKSLDFDIMWFVYAQTSAYLITAGITFMIVVKKADFLKLKWSFPFSIMILKKSLPFAILVLLMTFYNRVDSVMLERILPNGAEQSGIYAKAYRLLDASNMIAYLFASLLLPMFAKMIKQNQNIEELIKLSFSLLIVPAVVVAFGCLFYSRHIMSLLYTSHIEESAEVFRILMFCFMAVSTTYIFGTLLTANGNLKELNIMAGAGMVLNITLNLILIPKFYAAGSALSSMITQFLTAIIQVFIASRIFKFRFNYRFLAIIFLFIAGTVVINIITLNLSSTWIFNFILMIGASICWAFIIRLISVKSIYRILRYG